MKALFIGLGSIAQKHIKALRKIYGIDLSIYAWRHTQACEETEGITNIYSAEHALNTRPDFIIISNHTAAHIDTIEAVFDWGIPLFIEKPLSHNFFKVETLQKKIAQQELTTYVACNLRFLGAINFIKEKLSQEKEVVNEVNAYCGSYLPDWRPTQDFKKSYSANKEMGGGVHLDLIHEIDYLVHLFGFPLTSQGIITSKSTLDIDASDYAHYILGYNNFSATVTLNYFRKNPKRSLEIITEQFVYIVDLISNTVIEETTGEEIFRGNDTIINTYQSQLKYFINLITSSSDDHFNSFAEAARILKIALNETE